jgi:hypothetical protein
MDHPPGAGANHQVHSLAHKRTLEEKQGGTHRRRQRYGKEGQCNNGTKKQQGARGSNSQADIKVHHGSEMRPEPLASTVPDFQEADT